MFHKWSLTRRSQWWIQQSDCEKSSASLSVPRDNRSSSAAASVRIEFLSGVPSAAPLPPARGEPTKPPGVPLRDNRSSSAAASVRIEFLSGVPSMMPLAGGRGEPPALIVPGVTVVPAFLLSNELKKLARTPSPPAVPGVKFGSIYSAKQLGIE